MIWCIFISFQIGISNILLWASIQSFTRIYLSMYYAQPKDCRAVRLFSGYFFFCQRAFHQFNNSSSCLLLQWCSCAWWVHNDEHWEKWPGKEQVVALGSKNVLTLPSSVYDKLQNSSRHKHFYIMQILYICTVTTSILYCNTNYFMLNYSVLFICL